MQLTMNLSEAEVILIVTALKKLPMETVESTVVNVITQANAQISQQKEEQQDTSEA